MMFRALSLVLALAVGAPASAQQAQPDFSLLDPAWAAEQTDANFQNGQSKVAWRALKRNVPDDDHAFVVEFANATLKHEALAPISGRFIQDHTLGLLALVRQAPVYDLARIQRQRAKLIQRLAVSNVGACAAVARGVTPVGGDFGQDADPAIATLLYEGLATFVDAAGAGRDKPTSHAALVQADIDRLKALVIVQGGSAEDADAIFLEGAGVGDDAQACRYGVMLYNATVAAPDETAAKFAVR
jgi:hypothetical protein